MLEGYSVAVYKLNNALTPEIIDDILQQIHNYSESQKQRAKEILLKNANKEYIVYVSETYGEDAYEPGTVSRIECVQAHEDDDPDEFKAIECANDVLWKLEKSGYVTNIASVSY